MWNNSRHREKREKKQIREQEKYYKKMGYIHTIIKSLMDFRKKNVKALQMSKNFDTIFHKLFANGFIIIIIFIIQNLESAIFNWYKLTLQRVYIKVIGIKAKKINNILKYTKLKTTYLYNNNFCLHVKINDALSPYSTK